MATEEPIDRGLVDNVWHMQVSLKVSLFAWCLLRNRLPTKDTLLRRRVLQPDDTMCEGGCGLLESVDHLFLGCNFFGSVWFLVWQWLGISTVGFGVLPEHFLQFNPLAGLPRFTHSFLKLIWLSCVWVISKERNNRVFKNTALDLHGIFGKVKLQSFL